MDWKVDEIQSEDFSDLVENGFIGFGGKFLEEKSALFFAHAEAAFQSIIPLLPLLCSADGTAMTAFGGHAERGLIVASQRAPFGHLQRSAREHGEHQCAFMCDELPLKQTHLIEDVRLDMKCS